MKNAEWMIKNGYKFSDLDAEYIDQEHGCKVTINGKTVEIVPVPFVLLNWLDREHVEPILDDTEKRYLKGVIRPFRDRVQSISKEGNSIVEWLSFKLVNNAPFELPFFKSGRMYKNMERGKEYTLDELGL